MIKLFVCVLLLLMPLLSVVKGADNEVDIEFSRNTVYDAIRTILLEDGTLEDGVAFINETFMLARPVHVRLGDLDGPLYDPESGDIQIPYVFYAEVLTRFAQIEDDDEVQATLVTDAILHTLFHELAHALIDQLSLPIVGKEEDAADALASVLLLEYYDAGAEIAGNAARLFALEGEDRGELEQEDFWDEHSLDEQRYFSTLCHIYGSDPAEFSVIATQAGFSAERREICVETYESLVHSWDLLLEPVFRND